MIRFDHVAISATALEDGAAWVGTTLGTPLGPVGYHPHMSTHNRLMSLGGIEYLEVIAVDPEAPDPGRPRWFDLDSFSGAPRLSNWIISVDDLDAAMAQMPGLGVPTELERGPYKWTVVLPEDGKLPFDGIHPLLIHWRSDHPAGNLARTDVSLTDLTVSHPEAEALAARIGLDDARVTFETGAPGLRATFDTPNGPRSL